MYYLPRRKPGLLRYGWQRSRWHGPPDRLTTRGGCSWVGGRDLDAAGRLRLLPRAGLTGTGCSAGAASSRATVVSLRPEQRRGREAVPLDGCGATGVARATGTAPETTRGLVAGGARCGVQATPVPVVSGRCRGRGTLVRVRVATGRLCRAGSVVVVVAEVAPASNERVTWLGNWHVTISWRVRARWYVTILHVSVRVKNFRWWLRYISETID